MTSTTVYFVGGIAAGTSQVMQEPLPAVWRISDLREEQPPVAFGSGDSDPQVNDKPLAVDTYILHTLARSPAVRVRAYIHADLQYGGMTDADLAHIPR